MLVSGGNFLSPRQARPPLINGEKKICVYFAFQSVLIIFYFRLKIKYLIMCDGLPGFHRPGLVLSDSCVYFVFQGILITLQTKKIRKMGLPPLGSDMSDLFLFFIYLVPNKGFFTSRVGAKFLHTLL